MPLIRIRCRLQDNVSPNLCLLLTHLQATATIDVVPYWIHGFLAKIERLFGDMALNLMINANLTVIQHTRVGGNILQRK